jgi:hypothetical protein
MGVATMRFGYLLISASISLLAATFGAGAEPVHLVCDLVSETTKVLQDKNKIVLLDIDEARGSLRMVYPSNGFEKEYANNRKTQTKIMDEIVPGTDSLVFSSNNISYGQTLVTKSGYVGSENFSVDRNNGLLKEDNGLLWRCSKSERKF